jgi:ABC-type branched-subunit amino acid transport system permease subunit
MDIIKKNLPKNRRVQGYVYALMVVAAAFLPDLFKLIGSTTFLVTEILIFAIFAVGFNLLLGFTGILSFGHAAWFGMAAYASALFQRHITPDSTLIPILFGIVFTTLVGALIGKLIIKTRGIYFAYVTIAFGQLVLFVVYRWTTLTNGENGLGDVRRLPLLKLFDIAPEYNFYLFVLAIFVVALILMRVIINSPFGRVLQAIRENRTRAIFVGYDVKSYELFGYILSVFYAAIAGTLYAFLLKYAFPESMSWSASGEVVIMTLVGGMHSLFGPVIGAFVITFLKDFISSYTDRWMIFLGIILVFFVLVSPEGIMGFFKKRSKENPLKALFLKGKKESEL